MTYRRFPLIVLIVVLLAACAEDRGTKQTIGTLGGAAVGGLLGAQIGGGTGKLAAVAIGSLAGAFLGSEIGKSLDRADRAYMERNAQSSLENNRSGTTSSWRNPDSGHSGTFTPTNTYQVAEGQYCREYESTIFVDGKEETAVGRACRQPDGTWRIVE